MRSATLLLVGLCLATGAVPAPLPELDAMLSRLARVARLYRDTVLEFACDEEIVDSSQDGRIFRFEYLYVYKERHGFADFRTFPGSRAEVRPPDVGVAAFLGRSFSWAFVFSENEQNLHRYWILEQDSIGGRPAIQLRFEPVAPYRKGVNDWHGTAWIDQESLQILRVEAVPHDSYEVLQRFEKDLQKARRSAPRLRRKRYVIQRAATDFTVEKNGMRFPGTTVITNHRYRIRGGRGEDAYLKRLLYRVEQHYDNYRFFSVRTRQEIHDIIFGED